MSAIYPKVHPRKIFDYFNNIFDQDKAKKLHSFSIARSICHMSLFKLVVIGSVICVSAFRVGYLDYCWQCCSLEHMGNYFLLLGKVIMLI